MRRGWYYNEEAAVGEEDGCYDGNGVSVMGICGLIVSSP